MAQQQKKTSRPASLQSLPNLPEAISYSQCVSFPPNELLICGGYMNKNCYSYHLQKQQYKLICSYPDDIKLNAHRVIFYPSHSSSNDHKRGRDTPSNTLTLLSFGGENN